MAKVTIEANITTLFAITLADFYSEGYSIINYRLMHQLGIEQVGYYLFSNPKSEKEVVYKAASVTKTQMETAQSRGWKITYLQTEYSKGSGLTLETVIVIESNDTRAQILNDQLEVWSEVEAREYAEGRLIPALTEFQK